MKVSLLQPCNYESNIILFISAMRFYTILRHNTQIKIWRPHLVIYIDTPVETAMKNIKKRNNVSLWQLNLQKCWSNY